MTALDRVREFFYPGSVRLGVSPVDGTAQFYRTINQILPDQATVLDFGAGRGAEFDDPDPWYRALVGGAPKVIRRCGCDVDPVVLDNAHLDEARVLRSADDFCIPWPDEGFDAVIADWVVEHLPAPGETFREILRVLKPGGWLCLRTPNRWHYAYLVAALVAGTPIEDRLLRIAQPARKEADVFPKKYKANTRPALTRHLTAAGFDTVTIVPSEPEAAYLNFHAATAVIGGIYHRIALAGLVPRAVLLGFARKL